MIYFFYIKNMGIILILQKKKKHVNYIFMILIKTKKINYQLNI